MNMNKALLHEQLTTKLYILEVTIINKDKLFYVLLNPVIFPPTPCKALAANKTSERGS